MAYHCECCEAESCDDCLKYQLETQKMRLFFPHRGICHKCETKRFWLSIDKGICSDCIGAEIKALFEGY
jgi:hypothetical protein